MTSTSTRGEAPRPNRRKASLAGWRLVEQLGRGAFGTAWRAEDPSGRPAALKLLAEPPGDEARALAGLAHPSIPALLAAGADPEPHLVMDLASGRSLDHWLADGPVEESVAIEIAGHLLDALAAVHDAGLVHGDIKPDNVVVASLEPVQLMVVDFGMVGRGGGTPDYASPERLSGGAPSMAADVYAAGLVLWELVHGEPPWSELPAGERLRLRLQGPPVPYEGSPWIQELLGNLLAADPSRRPKALEVVDVLVSRGAALPNPDAAMLRRRARARHVVRPAVEAQIQRVLEKGGALSLVGVRGSGRTQQLERVATELAARGTPFALVQPMPRRWGAIEAALSATTLRGGPVPLPSAADELERAERAVDALVARGGKNLVILVDDHDQLDRGSRLVLGTLLRRGGVRIIAAGDTPVDERTRVAELSPLDADGVADLTRALLGADGHLAAGVQPVLELSSGLPGMIVGLVQAGIDHGVWVRHTSRWIVDESRLEALRFVDLEAAPEIEDADARLVAATLALCGGPVGDQQLTQAAALSRARVAGALRVLEGLDLVRQRAGQVCLARPALARTLAGNVQDAVPIHARLLEQLLESQDPDVARLAWHAAGAGDAETVATLGPDAVASAVARDPADAARLAEALWAVAPSDSLAVARAQALYKAGRGDDAISFAETWLDGRDADPEQIELLLTLAGALSVSGHQERARDALSRARALGGDNPPMDVIVAEVQHAFRDGRHEEAIAGAEPHDSGQAPSGSAARALWLKLRMAHAQSLHALGRLDEALTLLDVNDDVTYGLAEGAVMHGVRGRLLWHAGRVREAAVAMEDGARLAVDTVARARMANNAGLAHYTCGDVPRAIDAWERALVLFERLELHQDLVRASTNIVIGYGDAARWARATEAGERALKLATRLEMPDLAAMALGNLGDVEVVRGNLEDAEARYAAARIIAEREDLQGELVELDRRGAEIAVHRNHPDARALAVAARERAESVGVPGEARKAEILEAVCAARDGESAKARSVLDQVLALLKEEGAGRELAEVRLWAAEVWLTLGDAAACKEELGRVLAYAEESGVASLRLRADRMHVRVDAEVPRDDPMSELERFLGVTAHLARHQDLDSLLNAAANSAQELLGADRAFVVKGQAHGFEVVAQSVAPGVEEGLPSRTVVGRTLRRARPVVVTDLGERGDLRAAESVVAMDLRFAACVPLIEGGVAVGALYADGQVTMERGVERVARVLEMLAGHVESALANVRALERSRARALQVSEVAHDLRGMLMVIDANVQEVMLELMDSKDDRVRALQDVMLASDRVHRLVGSLLRSQRQKSSPVDLVAVTEGLLGWLASEARGRGVLLESDLGGPAVIAGDPDEVARALVHVVTQAIRAAPYGHAVAVALHTEENDAVVRVRGMHPEDPSGGTDISVARRIVRVHGGQLDVVPRDRDTDVIVRLPLMQG